MSMQTIAKNRLAITSGFREQQISVCKCKVDGGRARLDGLPKAVAGSCGT